MALLLDNEGEFGVEIRDAPPAHLLMKIESFSKLSKHGIQKQESREFVAGTNKWRVIIYPQVSGGNGISLYLSVAHAESLPVEWKVKADCSILLHNQISNKYLCFQGKARRFDATNPKWGFSISKNMLAEPSSGFVVDDKCVFGAEVFLSETNTAIECLSFFDWKISDFSKLKSVWTSQDFLAGGFQWKMKLYPNGNCEAKGKSVSIYLECVDSKTFASYERVKADFFIRLKNKSPHAHLCKHTCHWFSCFADDWGYEHFIPISDMRDSSKGFIVDDCIFLEAEISVQDAVYKPKKPKVEKA